MADIQILFIWVVMDWIPGGVGMSSGGYTRMNKNTMNDKDQSLIKTVSQYSFLFYCQANDV